MRAPALRAPRRPGFAPEPRAASQPKGLVAGAANARDLLLQHKRALEQVVAENVFSSTTAKAKRYLLAVNADLAKPILEGPYGTAAKWGPNLYGPAIADVIAEAEFHKRPPHVEEDFHIIQQEAAE